MGSRWICHQPIDLAGIEFPGLGGARVQDPEAKEGASPEEPGNRVGVRRKKKKRGKEREGKEEKKKGEKKKAKGTQKHTKAFWCDAKHTMQSTGEGKVQGRQAGRYIYIYVCVLPHTIFDAYICARGAGRFRIVL